MEADPQGEKHLFGNGFRDLRSKFEDEGEKYDRKIKMECGTGRGRVAGGCEIKVEGNQDLGKVEMYGVGAWWCVGHTGPGRGRSALAQ